MPIAYVLINSELGTDTNVISQIKKIFEEDQISSYEIQGVYGVYDIVVKISSDDEKLRNITEFLIVRRNFNNYIINSINTLNLVR